MESNHTSQQQMIHELYPEYLFRTKEQIRFDIRMIVYFVEMPFEHAENEAGVDDL